ILLLLAMSSCKGQKSSTSSPVLAHDTYNVVFLFGVDYHSAKTPTLRFNIDQKKVSGFTGCNSYSAPLKVQENRMETGPARVTKLYCQNHMKTERDFLLSLRNLKTYRIEKNKIYFYNEEGNLILKAIKPAGNE